MQITVKDVVRDEKLGGYRAYANPDHEGDYYFIGDEVVVTDGQIEPLVSPKIAEETTHPFKFNGDYDNVIEWVKQQEIISVGRLQRQFKLGYNKGCDLLGKLKWDGIINPNNDKGYYKVI